MTQSMLLQLGRDTLQITLLLSLPLLAVSLVLGIVIGLIQAATQVHEATLSFVPKVLATALILALLGPWMTQNVLQFTARLFNMLPTLAH